MNRRRNSASLALLETLVVCAAYISLAHLAVAKDIFGASRWFGSFTPTQAAIAAGFATGVIAQVALVAILIIIPGLPHVRRAVSTLPEPAATRGWVIALAVLVVEVASLYAGWIGDIRKLFDTSLFGISMSLVPAVDGITQEIVFRGYVILRLAEAGFSRFVQILVSGALFASIHFSYGTGLNPDSLSSLLSALVPVIGTFGLGAAWAFAFQQSGFRLLPVATSHVLVILLVQPWLAMSYVQ